jgi:hypothetical protein
MATPPTFPTIDPDNVPETLCDGRFYLTWSGRLGTLTFTCVRPKADVLFDQGKVNNVGIVRARIVMSIENLVALRDMLTASIKVQPGAEPSPIMKH